MRKVLAGFLATAMVASVCATMTLAASAASTTMEITVPEGTLNAAVTATKVTMIVHTPDGKKTTYTSTVNAVITKEKADAAATEAEEAADKKYEYDAASIAKAIASAKSFNGVTIDGRLFDVALSASGNTVTATLDSTYMLSEKGQQTEIDFQVSAGSSVVLTTAAGADFTANPGTEKMDANVDQTGSKAYNITDVVLCDEAGNPLPMVESNDDRNDADGAKTGKTIYFMVQKGDYSFDNEDYWKLKISKGKNGKYVKNIDDVTKKFGSNLVRLSDGAEVKNTADTRHRFIKVELAELFTDDEYKITLDLRLSARSDAAKKYGPISEDDEIKVNDFSFWIANSVKSADNDWKVGIGGLMLNPIGNDWNEVTYYDEDSDVAYMKFFADSDTGKFYAKLSTKWEHEDYRSFFNNQDAFFFQFTGSPSISSTSRCDLQIYNPFVDEDGNETIDPETAVIYELVDGELINVTDKFQYEEGENGDMAFTTRTRFLGTYIICEHEADLGDDNMAGSAPGVVAPEDVAPTPVTPDGGSGAKTPPNTGRF